MFLKTTRGVFAIVVFITVTHTSAAALQAEQPISPSPTAQPADAATQPIDERAPIQTPAAGTPTTPTPGRALPAPNTPAGPAPGGSATIPLSPILLLAGLLLAAIIIGILSIFRRKK